MPDATEHPHGSERLGAPAEMPELMIAGPGEVHDETLEVFGRQMIAHYGDVWTDLHGQTLRILGELLGASDPPYLLPGTGTTCLDAALFNVFEPGQKVVVANTGFFGVRLMEMARQHRLEVLEVEVPVGAPIDPSAIAKAAAGVPRDLINTFVSAKLHPIRPTVLIYNCTWVCDARCTMCSNWKWGDRKSDMTLAQLEPVLDDPFWGAVENLNISGGEPTTRNDLPEMVEMFHRHLPRLRKIGINTTGLTPHRAIPMLTRIVEFCASRGRPGWRRSRCRDRWLPSAYRAIGEGHPTRP